MWSQDFQVAPWHWFFLVGGWWMSLGKVWWSARFTLRTKIWSFVLRVVQWLLLRTSAFLNAIQTNGVLAVIRMTSGWTRQNGAKCNLPKHKCSCAKLVSCAELFNCVLDWCQIVYTCAQLGQNNKLPTKHSDVVQAHLLKFQCFEDSKWVWSRNLSSFRSPLDFAFKWIEDRHGVCSRNSVTAAYGWPSGGCSWAHPVTSRGDLSITLSRWLMCPQYARAHPEAQLGMA